MKDNIDNIGDYLGQCMDMFFWDYVSYKNTPSTRATKIFKNTEDIGMGYIWCCCHTSFRHRQINVQTKAANV